MTRLGLIQPDGRVHHLLGFEPRTLLPIEFHTAQGYDDHSQWTRAQGWGMSSTVFAYEATGDRRFLHDAVKVCDYFLAHMLAPGSTVPYYDIADPRLPDVPRDTCTATLAANAMVRLMHADPGLESKYRDYVERAIVELLEQHTTPEGIVVHGSWGNMWGNVAECVMPYGNLFLTETLYRVLHPEADLWGNRPFPA
jgi:unsaturated chondroitin disaccharide hydrolase